MTTNTTKIVAIKRREATIRGLYRLHEELRQSLDRSNADLYCIERAIALLSDYKKGERE